MEKRSSHLPRGISSINTDSLRCLRWFKGIDFKTWPRFQTACCDEVEDSRLPGSPHLPVLCPLPQQGEELTARAGLTSAQRTHVYLFGVKPPPSVHQWLPSQVNSRELIMITFDFPKTFPWQSLHPSYWYLSEVEGRMGKAKSLLPAQVHSL